MPKKALGEARGREVLEGLPEALAAAENVFARSPGPLRSKNIYGNVGYILREPSFLAASRGALLRRAT